MEYAQLSRSTEQNFKALKDQCLFDLNRMKAELLNTFQAEIADIVNKKIVDAVQE